MSPGFKGSCRVCEGSGFVRVITTDDRFRISWSAQPTAALGDGGEARLHVHVLKSKPREPAAGLLWDTDEVEVLTACDHGL